VKINRIKAIKDEKEIFISADTLVFSFGIVCNSETINDIQDFAGSVPVYPVGDCAKAGKLGAAVWSGYIMPLGIV
jgi:hypothetical protein